MIQGEGLGTSPRQNAATSLLYSLPDIWHPPPLFPSCTLPPVSTLPDLSPPPPPPDRLPPPAWLNTTPCLGIRADGTPCKSTFVALDGYCRHHSLDPAKRAAARADSQRAAAAASSAAGTKSGEARRLLPLGSLRTASRRKFYMAHELHDKLRHNRITQADAAAFLSISEPTLSRYWKELQTMEGQYAHTISSAAARSLYDFRYFRDRYFRTEEAKPYKTAPFHMEWIEATIAAIEDGGRLLILSPPRHGKTELMMHFAVWLILRNPNIRIMWVSSNKDIGLLSTAGIKETLEANELLISDFVGPTGSFAPDQRRGRSWTSSSLTVSTRTQPGIKAPTLVALSRGTKLRSRDADFIVVDDPEDPEDVENEDYRRATERWSTVSLLSRKEEKTAVVMISSRVHHDDLAGKMLANPLFKSLVYAMHDPACMKPPEQNGVHQSCMLWPDGRSYKYMREQRQGYEALLGGSEGRRLFEMVYQNVILAEHMLGFRAEVVDECLDRSLTLGPDLGRDWSLIVGHDPAPVNYQASVLWGYKFNPFTLCVVDLDNAKGGGLAGTAELVEQWYKTYGVTEWVFEDNAYQTSIAQERVLRRYCIEHGINLHGHSTGVNKHNKEFGVTSMIGLFERREIILPYGDENSVSKIDQLRRQLFNYTGKKRGGTSDLVMAAWFPIARIRAMQHSNMTEAVFDYDSPMDPGIVDYIFPSYEGFFQ